MAHSPLPQYCAYLVLASEFGLLLWRRAGADTRREDHGSLRLLWLTIAISMPAAILCSYNVREADLPLLRSSGWSWAGIVLVLAGLCLRWYAILYLGRYFTVNVAITPGQRVIDTGPYRYLRHPSYSGSLLSCSGIGLICHNWLSLLLTLLPPTLVYLWRIRIEESAMRSAFGDAYVQYAARTARLVPFIY